MIRFNPQLFPHVSCKKSSITKNEILKGCVKGERVNSDKLNLKWCVWIKHISTFFTYKRTKVISRTCGTINKKILYTVGVLEEYHFDPSTCLDRLPYSCNPRIHYNSYFLVDWLFCCGCWNCHFDCGICTAVYNVVLAWLWSVFCSPVK